MTPDPEKPDTEDKVFDADAAEDREAPTRSDELADELREMMQAAEDLPLPEHLVKLIDELEADDERAAEPKAANGRLRS